MTLALKKLGAPAEVIQLIRSLHMGMKAKICHDGSLLEQLSVQNGPRQGCCMAPVHFNLFTCLVTERWLARRWGDEETAAEKVKKRRLQWLGHLARCQKKGPPSQLYLVGYLNHVLAVALGGDGGM